MFKRIGVAALVSAALVSGQAMAVTGGGATIPARLLQGRRRQHSASEFQLCGNGKRDWQKRFFNQQRCTVRNDGYRAFRSERIHSHNV